MALGLHIYIRYNAGKLIDRLVRTHSKGTYTLKQGKLRIDYASLTLEMSDVNLSENDKAGQKVVFQLKTPFVRFQLHSIWSLLSRKSLEVDNFFVRDPHISIRKREGERRDAFRSSGDVYKYIQKFVSSLQVREFLIENGSFDILPENGEKPLYHFGEIRFGINNMRIDSLAGERNDQAFYSENIFLEMKNEQIVFPDSLREVRFTKLFLSSREKVLHIDSVTYSTSSNSKNDGNKNAISVFLPSMKCINTDYAGLYNDKVIRIDTVECDYPEIVAAFDMVKKEKQPELKVVLKQIVQRLFGDVDVKYFRLKHAKLKLLAKLPGVTREIEIKDNDFIVNNLTVSGEDTSALAIGSIRFMIHDYSSISPDKGYRLGMDEFLINENSGVTVTNLKLYSTTDSAAKTTNYISVPSISIESIDLGELLLEKKIVAGRMVLTNPQITYTLSGKPPKKTATGIFEALGTYDQIADVKSLQIINGNVCVTFPRQKMTACLSDLSINVSINTALEAKNYYALLRAADNISFAKGTVKSPSVNAELLNGQFIGATNSVTAARTRVSLPKEKISGYIDGLAVTGLLFDESRMGSSFFVDSIKWKSANFDVEGIRDSKEKTSGNSDKAFTLHAGRVWLPDTKIRNLTAGRWKIVAPEVNLFAEQLHFEDRKLSFNDLRLSGSDLAAVNDRQSVRVSNFSVANKKTSHLSGISFRNRSETDSMETTIQQISMFADFDKLKEKKISFSSLDITSPVFVLTQWDRKTKDTVAKKEGLTFSFARTSVSNGRFEMNNTAGETVSHYKASDIDLSARDLQFRTDDLWGSSSFERLILGTSSASLSRTDSTYLSADGLALTLNASRKIADEPSKPKGSGGQVSVHPILIEKAVLKTGNIVYNTNALRASATDLILGSRNFALKDFGAVSWKNSVAASVNSIQSGNLQFSDAQNKFNVSRIWSEDLTKTLRLDSFRYTPVISRDSFLRSEEFETDYVEKVEVAALELNGFNALALVRDSSFVMRSLGVNGFDVRIFRDKNLPDLTGIYKRLPQTMLRSSTQRLSVDTVNFSNGYVAYTEVSEKTKLPATFFFSDTEGTLINVKTLHYGSSDTFQVTAKASMLGKANLTLGIWAPIADTLAAFRTVITSAPFSMDTLNSVINPMSNARVTSGRLDSVYLEAQGNDLFASGRMLFQYHNLHVRLDDNVKKRSLLSKIKTFVADKIILRHRNEDKYGAVFFRRNQEKFIFNYLVKIAVSGFLSSTGVKSNKSYLKLLEKEKELLEQR